MIHEMLSGFVAYRAAFMDRDKNTNRPDVSVGTKLR